MLVFPKSAEIYASTFYFQLCQNTQLLCNTHVNGKQFTILTSRNFSSDNSLQNSIHHYRMYCKFVVLFGFCFIPSCYSKGYKTFIVPTPIPPFGE